jgi:hypothetical protein
MEVFQHSGRMLALELDEMIGFARQYGSDHAFGWQSRAAESFDEQRNPLRSASDGGAAEAGVVALCRVEACEQGEVVANDQ